MRHFNLISHQINRKMIFIPEINIQGSHSVNESHRKANYRDDSNVLVLQQAVIRTCDVRT
ncbi:hypothetical protein TSUD_307780 [Trifolium subterraneum]|nr:hypothetical protein TSUD_307780 [Trifolium subterraneum]